MLESSSADGPWTDEKNERRLQLIDKRISASLNEDEEVELSCLQMQAEKHFDAVAPLPMDGLKELHQQLLDRRDSK